MHMRINTQGDLRLPVPLRAVHGKQPVSRRQLAAGERKQLDDQTQHP